MMFDIPEFIRNDKELDEFLAQPYSELVDYMKIMKGDLMILGAGGKMGPSLAKLAKNAINQAGVKKNIIVVSRFSDKELLDQFNQFGIQTITCDLLYPDNIKTLPKVENIIFMVGRKFGLKGSETLTWMTNTVIPEYVIHQFYKSRFVVFSTGCIYPLVKRESGGSLETDAPQPMGEYASSCLGRERIFQYYSETYETKSLLFRLNYAIDLRYGILIDIAQNIYNDKPVDLTIENINLIWQGDANNRALLSFNYVSNPPKILNITGEKILSIENMALIIGKLLNKKVKFINRSIDSKGYLSNARQSIELFGLPKISLNKMIKWTAYWIQNNGPIWNKPTSYQVIDGQFLK